MGADTQLDPTIAGDIDPSFFTGSKPEDKPASQETDIDPSFFGTPPKSPEQPQPRLELEQADQNIQDLGGGAVGYLTTLLSSAARGAVSDFTGIPKFIGEATGLHGLTDLGVGIENATNALTPLDAKYAEGFSAKVASGVGALGGMFIPGLAWAGVAGKAMKAAEVAAGAVKWGEITADAAEAAGKEFKIKDLISSATKLLGESAEGTKAVQSLQYAKAAEMAGEATNATLMGGQGAYDAYKRSIERGDGPGEAIAKGLGYGSVMGIVGAVRLNHVADVWKGMVGEDAAKVGLNDTLQEAAKASPSFAVNLVKSLTKEAGIGAAYGSGLQLVQDLIVDQKSSWDPILEAAGVGAAVQAIGTAIPSASHARTAAEAVRKAGAPETSKALDETQGDVNRKFEDFEKSAPPAEVPPTPPEKKESVAVNAIYQATEPQSWKGTDDVPISLDDASFLADHLSALADRGKLTPESFSQTEIGQRLSTDVLMTAKEEIKQDPAGFVNRLKSTIDSKIQRASAKSEPPAVEGETTPPTDEAPTPEPPAEEVAPAAEQVLPPGEEPPTPSAEETLPPAPAPIEPKTELETVAPATAEALKQVVPTAEPEKAVPQPETTPVEIPPSLEAPPVAELKAETAASELPGQQPTTPTETPLPPRSSPEASQQTSPPIQPDAQVQSAPVKSESQPSTNQAKIEAAYWTVRDKEKNSTPEIYDVVKESGLTHEQATPVLLDMFGKGEANPVRGEPNLLSNEKLSGAITINDKEFHNIELLKERKPESPAATEKSVSAPEAEQTFAPHVRQELVERSTAPTAAEVAPHGQQEGKTIFADRMARQKDPETTKIATMEKQEKAVYPEAPVPEGATVREETGHSKTKIKLVKQPGEFHEDGLFTNRTDATAQQIARSYKVEVPAEMVEAGAVNPRINLSREPNANGNYEVESVDHHDKENYGQIKHATLTNPGINDYENARSGNSKIQDRQDAQQKTVNERARETGSLSKYDARIDKEEAAAEKAGTPLPEPDTAKVQKFQKLVDSSTSNLSEQFSPQIVEDVKSTAVRYYSHLLRTGEEPNEKAVLHDVRQDYQEKVSTRPELQKQASLDAPVGESGTATRGDLVAEVEHPHKDEYAEHSVSLQQALKEYSAKQTRNITSEQALDEWAGASKKYLAAQDSGKSEQEALATLSKRERNLLTEVNRRTVQIVQQRQQEGLSAATSMGVRKSTPIDKATLRRIGLRQYVTERVPESVRTESDQPDLQAAEAVARRSREAVQAGNQPLAEHAGIQDRQDQWDQQQHIEKQLKPVEEKSLKNWEKANDKWVDDKDFTAKWIAGGKKGETEHQVYYDKESNRWFKRNNLLQNIDNGQLGYLQRIMLHNALFPESALRFEGYTEHEGELMPVVSQPHITGRDATIPEIRDHMDSLGFTEIGKTNTYLSKDGTIQVGDLHGANALKLSTGEVVIIDPVIKMTEGTKIERLQDMAARGETFDAEEESRKSLLAAHRELSDKIQRGESLHDANDHPLVQSVKTEIGRLYPDIEVKAEKGQSSMWVTEDGVVHVDPEKLQAKLDEYPHSPGLRDRMINEEVSHVSGLMHFQEEARKEISRDDYDTAAEYKKEVNERAAQMTREFGASLSDKVATETARTYELRAPIQRQEVSREDYPTQEAYEKAVATESKAYESAVAAEQRARNQAVEDLKADHFRLAHEFLRMVRQRYENGFSTEDLQIPHDPGIIGTIRKYLQAAVRFLKARLQAAFDPELSRHIQSIASFERALGRREEAMSDLGLDLEGQQALAASNVEQTSTPNFLRWFKESKVTDADGKPLTVYTGSPHELGDVFKPARHPGLVKAGRNDFGYFFTPNTGVARAYAGKDGVVKPQYLSIQKPLDLREAGQTLKPEEMRAALEKAGVNTEGLDMVPSTRRAGGDAGVWAYFDNQSAEIRSAIKAAGYDGVVFDDNTAAGDSWVAFESGQIKSPQNRGTFDAENPNTLFAAGDRRDSTALYRVLSTPLDEDLKDLIREKQYVTESWNHSEKQAQEWIDLQVGGPKRADFENDKDFAAAQKKFRAEHVNSVADLDFIASKIDSSYLADDYKHYARVLLVKQYRDIADSMKERGENITKAAEIPNSAQVFMDRGILYDHVKQQAARLLVPVQERGSQLGQGQAIHKGIMQLFDPDTYKSAYTGKLPTQHAAAIGGTKTAAVVETAIKAGRKAGAESATTRALAALRKLFPAGNPAHELLDVFEGFQAKVKEAGKTPAKRMSKQANDWMQELADSFKDESLGAATAKARPDASAAQLKKASDIIRKVFKFSEQIKKDEATQKTELKELIDDSIEKFKLTGKGARVVGEILTEAYDTHLTEAKRKVELARSGSGLPVKTDVVNAIGDAVSKRLISQLEPKSEGNKAALDLLEAQIKKQVQERFQEALKKTSATKPEATVDDWMKQLAASVQNTDLIEEAFNAVKAKMNNSGGPEQEAVNALHQKFKFDPTPKNKAYEIVQKLFDFKAEILKAKTTARDAVKLEPEVDRAATLRNMKKLAEAERSSLSDRSAIEKVIKDSIAKHDLTGRDAEIFTKVMADAYEQNIRSAEAGRAGSGLPPIEELKQNVASKISKMVLAQNGVKATDGIFEALDKKITASVRDQIKEPAYGPNEAPPTDAEHSTALLNSLVEQVGNADLAERAFNQAVQETLAATPKPMEARIARLQGMKFDQAKYLDAAKFVKTGVDFREMVTKTLEQQDSGLFNLLNSVSAATGLQGKQAAMLADAIRSGYDLAARQETRKQLDRLAQQGFNREANNGVMKLTEPQIVKLLKMVNLGAFKEAKFFNALAPSFKLPAYNEAFADKIEKQAAAIQKMPENSDARNEAGRQLLTDIAKQRVSELTGLNKVWHYLGDIAPMMWQAGVLMGPPTQLVNYLYSQAHVLVSATSDAAGYIAAAKKAGIKTAHTGDFLADVVLGSLRSFGMNNPEGNVASQEFRKAITTATTRFHNERGGELSLLENEKLAVLHKYVGRFMVATDTINQVQGNQIKQRMALRWNWLQEGHSREEVAKRMEDAFNPAKHVLDQIDAQVSAEKDAGFLPKKLDQTRRRAELLEKRRFEMLDGLDQNSRETADYGTFNLQNPTGMLGKIIDQVIKPINHNFKVTKFALSFMSTLANLVNVSLDWSPVGIGRGHNLFGEEIWDPKFQRNFKPGSPEQFSQLAKGWVGTMAMIGLGAAMFKSWDDEDQKKKPFFAIYGEGPKDPFQRRQLEEGSDWQANTLKVGDMRIRYTDLPALSLALGVMGQMSDIRRAHEGQIDENTMITGALAIGSQLLQKNLLKGVSDIVKIMSDPTGQGPSAAKSFAGGILGGFGNPQLLKWAKSTLDMNENGLVPQVEQSSMKGWLYSMLPFAGGYNTPSLNVLGEPIGNYPWKSTVSRFGGYGQTNTPSNPILSPLVDASLFIPTPSKTMMLGKGDKAFGVGKDQEIWRRFVELRGEELKKQLTPERIQRLTQMDHDTAQSAIDEHIAVRARDIAKRKVELEFGIQ